MVATLHPKARTVALVGPSGVGKTSLLEALVFSSGGLERPGRVEDGSTLCGADPEERRHQMSLGISMAPIWIGDDKLTILDTPGFIDFHGDVQRALEVADVAVLVVSAVPRATAEIEVLWDIIQRSGVPVVVFINALDAERADYASTLNSLEGMIGPILAPLELPLGEGPTAEGIVDLLGDVAITYSTGKPKSLPIPAELVDLESRVRSSLMEAIVVGDDSLTEKYLAGEEPSLDELESVLGHLMSAAGAVPLTCGSAIRGIGIDRLATLLDEIAESRPITLTEDGTDVELARDADADLVLRAFKIIVDPYVGRIVVVEVVSGTLVQDLSLVNVRTRSEERIHSINHLFGTKLRPTDRAVAGDVVAIAKLNDVVVGDVLATRGRNLTAPPVPAPLPALSVALVSGSHDEDDKIASALHRLAEEDASLGVRHDPVSRRLVIDVMGDVHLQVTLERLNRRFNINVDTAPPSVALFETIRAARDTEGRLKKQTGGHGQYAVVNLKIEPIEPTAPLEFIDAVVGGAVPRQFIGAVRHGVEKAMAHGGPQGHPVVGLRITLHDGKFHSVDSSEAAFETAASLGLRAALEQAGTMVLERVMVVTAVVPPENLGDVLNDLSVRRGRVISTQQDERMNSVVTAHVPEVELHRYGLQLRTMTSGRGHATFEVHHLAEATKATKAK